MNACRDRVTAKNLLVLYNVAVAAVGCILMSIGSWIMHFANKYQDLFINDELVVVTSLLVSVGLFLFAFSFLGCFGAYRKHSFLLKMYFSLLTIGVIMQIAAAATAFAFVSGIMDSMIQGMTSTINNTYGHEEHPSATDAVDTIQIEFECCGATGVTDFAGCTGIPQDTSVPESCCKDPNNGCNGGDDARPGYPDPTMVDLINTNGCVDESIEFVEHYLFLLGGVCFGLLVIECLALYFTYSLLRDIPEVIKSEETSSNKNETDA